MTPPLEPLDALYCALAILLPGGTVHEHAVACLGFELGLRVALLHPTQAHTLLEALAARYQASEPPMPYQEVLEFQWQLIQTLTRALTPAP
jgi:hypothetical protein